jgi:putative transcriptional regulator
MSFPIKNIETHFEKPQRGDVLLSEPYLDDYFFRRSVVLISDHNEEGSVGFVLNRLVDLHTNDVIPGLLAHNFPLLFGGPVEPNTLHFIHKVGEIVEGSQLIANGIYWGGDIECVDMLLKRNIATPEEFKFFSGYSGWAAGQLDDELEHKAWWIGKGGFDIVFDKDLDNMWRKMVRQMHQQFAYMANAPEDRSWN